MPTEKKISVDEFMAKRASKMAGDKLVLASKAPTSWDKSKRSAVFTMSTQDEDRDGDIVFTAGIDTTEFMKNPVCLLFHKSREFPIGTWGDLKKGATKLDGTATLVPPGVLDEADKAAALIENGVLRACSIGFIPKTISMRTLDNGQPAWSYEIREAELVECSIVPIPAHPQALIKEAQGDMTLARALLEEVLDTYAKTPDGLIVPRHEYERAYKAVSVKDAPRAPAAPAEPAGEEKTHTPEEVAAAIAIVEKAGGVVPVFKAITKDPVVVTPPVTADDEKTFSEKLTAAIKSAFDGLRGEKTVEAPKVPTADEIAAAMARAKAVGAKARAEHTLVN